MLSLFCVLVDVLAQLANNRVHAAMIVTSTICLISFIGFSVVVLIIERQMNASEGNSSGDLRTVSDRIEKKSVILVVDAECPITDLSENATGEVDPDHALDLPHQVGTDIEPSDLAANGRVKHFIKVVAATESDVWIEPVLVFRESLVQRLIQAKCELIGDPRLCRTNYSIDSGPASDAPRHER